MSSLLIYAHQRFSHMWLFKKKVNNRVNMAGHTCICNTFLIKSNQIKSKNRSYIKLEKQNDLEPDGGSVFITVICSMQQPLRLTNVLVFL